MYPESIQKLIDLFSKFPTIGPRTARRFVFYLLRMPNKEFDELLSSIENLKKSIKICSFCFSHFESQPGQESETLCPICRNETRKRNLLCIVEKEIDLISIEKTHEYKGLYFILGELISLRKAKKLSRLDNLLEKVKNHNFEEIIIALNPTTQGKITSLYIERALKSIEIPKNKNLPKITHLARGIPSGGELEYADEETLKSAFEGRN